VLRGEAGSELFFVGKYEIKDGKLTSCQLVWTGNERSIAAERKTFFDTAVARFGGEFKRDVMDNRAEGANEWEDYSISNEALQDFELRDDLIALGLDPRTGTGRGQRSAISIDGGRNTTNNVLDAKRGYVASLHLEQAGRWLGGDYNYYEFTGEGRYYVSLGGRAVVAVMARAGNIDDLGSSDVLQVPFYKRYFLGGATNLRGWGRFDVAPLSGSGFPLGGHSFANFSTEVRVPLVGNLGGVLFLDGGNVWSDPWGFDADDMRYDVGPGIRYNTPIGPIRADLGYQLNPIPGLLVNGKPEPRRFRFHFSIGQAF
jgi:outer membrane protein insertion porin family/translocation and assembly module TamA